MIIQTQAKVVRSILYVMAIGNFAVGIGSLVVAGVLQPMANDLNVTFQQIGLLITIYALAYAIGSPLIIAFTGSFDRRNLLLFGLLLATLGNFVTAFSPNYSVVFTARIFIALGAAIFTPIASAVAATISQAEERGSAIALVFAGFTAATALGVPLGTYIGLNVGWRMSFVMVAILALISLLAVWQIVPTGIQTAKVDLGVFRRAMNSPVIVGLLLVTMFQLAAQLSLFTYLTPYLQARTSLGAVGITLLFLCNGVAGFFGNLLGGYLSDYIGAKMTTLIFLILLALSFPLVPLVENSLLIGALALGTWGAFGLGFNAPQQTRLIGIAPSLASAVLGLNASFLYLGISAGSALGGQISQRFGIEVLPWLALGLTILTILTFGLTYSAKENDA